jgi:hypothetical protein
MKTQSNRALTILSFVCCVTACVFIFAKKSEKSSTAYADEQWQKVAHGETAKPSVSSTRRENLSLPQSVEHINLVIDLPNNAFDPSEVWVNARAEAIEKNVEVAMAAASIINSTTDIDACKSLLTRMLNTAENDFNYLRFCSLLNDKKIRAYAVASLCEELINRGDCDRLIKIHAECKDTRMRIAILRSVLEEEVFSYDVESAFSMVSSLPSGTERTIAIGNLACELCRNELMNDDYKNKLLSLGISQNQLRTASFYKPPPPWNLFD